MVVKKSKLRSKTKQSKVDKKNFVICIWSIWASIIWWLKFLLELQQILNLFGIRSLRASDTTFTIRIFKLHVLQLKWFGDQIYFYKMTVLPHEIYLWNA